MLAVALAAALAACAAPAPSEPPFTMHALRPRSREGLLLAVQRFVDEHGSHLHFAVSDCDGRTVGGRLLPGCSVETTTELVLGDACELVFTRAVQGTTPWRELQIARRRAQ